MGMSKYTPYLNEIGGPVFAQCLTILIWMHGCVANWTDTRVHCYNSNVGHPTSTGR